MDDRQNNEARTPLNPSPISEQQLRRVLDECLWQVERLRVDGLRYSHSDKSR